MNLLKRKGIAMIGGGPAALFLLKNLLDTKDNNLPIHIFESGSSLGKGMPYSDKGANKEHSTNVSGNEIPKLPESLVEWMGSLPEQKLNDFGLTKKNLSPYHVIPRLLFGEYLEAQFEQLLHRASKKGIEVIVHLSTKVVDITDQAENSAVVIKTGSGNLLEFDKAIICSGHKWPKKNEGKVAGYFDSPYPPSKLDKQFNHPVALRGSSLTAIDAIRTLSRANGKFSGEGEHKLVYEVNPSSPRFKIVMHSKGGLLPGVRFHLEDSQLSNERLLTQEEILEHMMENDGFLSLDFIFDKNFKESIRKKDPVFYEVIREMKMEDFVEAMMDMREKSDAFALLRYEYEEAERSIKTRTSVYWKEMLAVLSFSMNYPAKHFSAEDMQRLKKVLMPLISIVIAFVPQEPCKEMFALQEAGCLDIISVNDDSEVKPDGQKGIIYDFADDSGQMHSVKYETYIDCVGQPPLGMDDFPFPGLVEGGILSEALLKFKNPEKITEEQLEDKQVIRTSDENAVFLKVPGMAITDSFNVIEKDRKINPRIYLMAVPYISGYNPDYSGLDFCEEAAGLVVSDLVEALQLQSEIEGSSK